MTNARCISACYDSGSATLYEAGNEYEVDETREWIQNHFDVPKTKPKKGRATTDGEDQAGGGADGETTPDAPAESKGKGKGKGAKSPGSLE